MKSPIACAGPSPEPPQAGTSAAQPGSYARYLMLNGVGREAAIRAAWTSDHPQTQSKRLDNAAPAKAQPPLQPALETKVTLPNRVSVPAGFCCRRLTRLYEAMVLRRTMR